MHLCTSEMDPFFTLRNDVLFTWTCYKIIYGSILRNLFWFSDCGSVDGTLVFGLSPQPYTIGISCLRKVEEIVESAHIRAHEYYVLPMKLPNRCVTQQLCLTPSNPFYNHLPGHRSSSKLLH